MQFQSQICEDLGLHYFIIHPPGGGSRLPELSLKDKADLVEGRLDFFVELLEYHSKFSISWCRVQKTGTLSSLELSGNQ